MTITTTADCFADPVKQMRPCRCRFCSSPDHPGVIRSICKISMLS